MSIDDVYQELILDHYKAPRCHGVLINPDRKVDLVNPLCGDQISLTVKFSGDLISAIAFTGHGCSISQATASLMAELLLGKSKEVARHLALLFRKMMKSEEAGSALDELGDAIALEGVKRHSARIKCALLPWDCIEKALAEIPPPGSMRDEIK